MELKEDLDLVGLQERMLRVGEKAPRVNSEAKEATKGEALSHDAQAHPLCLHDGIRLALDVGRGERTCDLDCSRWSSPESKLFHRP